MASRSFLALAAAVLAGVAAIVSALDHQAFMIPFFTALAVMGGLGAWAVREPYAGRRRSLAAVLAVLWLGSAAIVGGLLVWERALCACSSPMLVTESTYLGLTATAYHAAAVSLGGALMAVAAFSRRLTPSATD